MEFTYASYTKLIELLQKRGYRISSYDDYSTKGRCAILRHDVDYSLTKANTFAQVEKRIGCGGVKSTFFLLLTSDFYNVFSINGQKIIDSILACGHEIGIHFDEAKYPDSFGSPEEIQEKILQEAEVLSHAIGMPVTKVSMHRPSKNIIKSNLKIPGMINTYSDEFFYKFKYISDSRRNWREPIEDIVDRRSVDKLQILIHPFWYNNEETNISTSIESFVNCANIERYEELDNNISQLSEIMKRTDVLAKK